MAVTTNPSTPSPPSPPPTPISSLAEVGTIRDGICDAGKYWFCDERQMVPVLLKRRHQAQQPRVPQLEHLRGVSTQQDEQRLHFFLGILSALNQCALVQKPDADATPRLPGFRGGGKV